MSSCHAAATLPAAEARPRHAHPAAHSGREARSTGRLRSRESTERKGRPGWREAEAPGGRARWGRRTICPPPPPSPPSRAAGSPPPPPCGSPPAPQPLRGIGDSKIWEILRPLHAACPVPSPTKMLLDLRRPAPPYGCGTQVRAASSPAIAAEQHLGSSSGWAVMSSPVDLRRGWTKSGVVVERTRPADGPCRMRKATGGAAPGDPWVGGCAWGTEGKRREEMRWVRKKINSNRPDSLVGGIGG